MEKISKKMLDAYTEAANNYDVSRYEDQKSKKLYLEVANKSFLRNLPQDNHIKILDFATGTGRLSFYLIEHGYKVVSVDITESMMRLGQKKQKEMGEKYIFWGLADGLALPFPNNTFDYIVTSKFFHIMENRFHPEFLNEFFRVLKPGGQIIADFNNVFFWLFNRMIRGKWRKGGRFYIPTQKNSLYKKWNISKIEGQWMPFSFLIFKLSKKLFKYYDSLSRSIFKYLCSKLIIVFEKSLNGKFEKYTFE